MHDSEGRTDIFSFAFPSSFLEFPCFYFDSPWRQENPRRASLSLASPWADPRWLVLHLLCVSELLKKLFRTEILNHNEIRNHPGQVWGGWSMDTLTFVLPKVLHAVPSLTLVHDRTEQEVLADCSLIKLERAEWCQNQRQQAFCDLSTGPPEREKEQHYKPQRTKGGSNTEEKESSQRQENGGLRVQHASSSLGILFSRMLTDDTCNCAPAFSGGVGASAIGEENRASGEDVHPPVFRATFALGWKRLWSRSHNKLLTSCPLYCLKMLFPEGKTGL